MAPRSQAVLFVSTMQLPVLLARAMIAEAVVVEVDLVAVGVDVDVVEIEVAAEIEVGDAVDLALAVVDRQTVVALATFLAERQPFKAVDWFSYQTSGVCGVGIGTMSVYSLIAIV
jgi:hypothetical protein